MPLCPSCYAFVSKKDTRIDHSEFPNKRFYVPMGVCRACGRFSQTDSFLMWVCPDCGVVDKSQDRTSCWNCEWVRKSFLQRLFGKHVLRRKALLELAPTQERPLGKRVEAKKRIAAVKALSSLQPDADIAEVLVRLACGDFNEDPDVQAAAQAVLLQSVGITAVAELAKRLPGSDAAIELLGRIGGDAARTALNDTLKTVKASDYSRRRSIEDAVSRIKS